MAKPQLIMTAKEIEDKDKWLEARNNFVGGSEASIVMGMNKYRSPFALWAEKTGKVAPENLDDKLVVQFGTYAEDFVAQQFTKATGKKVKRTGLYVNEKYPFACASIDRMIIGENSLLECKTTGEFNKADWQGDNIPDAYYVQCLHYMAVMEMEYCYIACMFGNGRDFIHKRIDFNKTDAETLMDAERKFWELVKSETPPAIDGTESCTAVLNEKFHGGLTERIDLPSEASDIIASLDIFNKQASDLKTMIDFNKNRLREILGDHELGYVGDRKITWKMEGSKGSFDTAGLKKAFPDIYNKFYTPGEKKRVLRIASAKNNED
jgi:putative phage-type endonuclease